MGGWKTKLIFIAIVFFAGYATAIYNSAPQNMTNTNQQVYSKESAVQNLGFSNGTLTQEFNKYLHSSLCTARDIIARTTVAIKRQIEQKMRERQMVSKK